MWHPMWGWGGEWGFAWGWFALLHVLWWVLIAAGVVAAWQWITGRRVRDVVAGERPRAILRERFARGEIDQAEYDERMRVLKG